VKTPFKLLEPGSGSPKVDFVRIERSFGAFCSRLLASLERAPEEVRFGDWTFARDRLVARLRELGTPEIRFRAAVLLADVVQSQVDHPGFDRLETRLEIDRIVERWVLALVKGDVLAGGREGSRRALRQVRLDEKRRFRARHKRDRRWREQRA